MSSVLITLILVVLGTAIVVFFSQEFAGLFKKIFAIPGMKLLLPLIVASWLIEYYEDWVLWILLWINDGLHIVIYCLAEYIPFQTGSLFFAHVMQLFLLASLPFWILYGIEKSRGMYEPWPYTYLLAMVMWLLGAVLLTVHKV